MNVKVELEISKGCIAAIGICIVAIICAIKAPEEMSKTFNKNVKNER